MATTTSREYFVQELRNRRAEAERTLNDLEGELANIQAKVEQARKRLDLIVGMLQMESPEDFPEAEPKPIRQPLAGGTSVKDAVEQLLRETGKPMHAKEVLAALQKRGIELSQKDPLATIVTVLVRGTKAGVYRRTGPNTFRRVQVE